MARQKPVITRTAAELAEALGLCADDALQIELRAELADRIARIVAASGLTHRQVAELAKTSRTRLTAILNRNLQGVSTDLLLRIVAALGYRPRLSIVRARPAA